MWGSTAVEEHGAVHETGVLINIFNQLAAFTAFDGCMLNRPHERQHKIMPPCSWCVKSCGAVFSRVRARPGEQPAAVRSFPRCGLEGHVLCMLAEGQAATRGL